MQLSYDQIFIIPLAIALMMLGLMGLLANRRERFKMVRISPRIFRCESCSKVYLTERKYPMASCPECGCMNDPIQR